MVPFNVPNWMHVFSRPVVADPATDLRPERQRLHDALCKLGLSPDDLAAQCPDASTSPPTAPTLREITRV